MDVHTLRTEWKTTGPQERTEKFFINLVNKNRDINQAS